MTRNRNAVNRGKGGGGGGGVRGNQKPFRLEKSTLHENAGKVGNQAGCHMTSHTHVGTTLPRTSFEVLRARKGLMYVR